MVCTISVKKFDLQVSDHNSLFLCTQHLQLGENHRALTKMNSKETTFGMYICMGGDIFSCSLFFKLLHVEHVEVFFMKGLVKAMMFYVHDNFNPIKLDYI